MVLLWKASHPHSSQQCSAPRLPVTAGLEFRLCWVSGTLGTIACAAWQWRCPSVPTLCGLPSQSLGSLAPSITISLLAGKKLVLVVVWVAGGCVRVVTSRDHAAWQALRREIRDFSRGQHQNRGCGKACARSLDGSADLPQHWWSDHNTRHELWTPRNYSAGCEKKEKVIRKHKETSQINSQAFWWADLERRRRDGRIFLRAFLCTFTCRKHLHSSGSG